LTTVVDGDFEWDEEKAASNLPSMAYRFPKPLPSSQILLPYTSTTGRTPNAWSSLECRFVIAFFSSCTSSSDDAIASSVLGRQLARRGMFTNPEVRHEAVG
jgi:hypothetical protein